MQLLLLARNAAGRMPYVLHSLITLFSLWFWKCLRFPTTCWFCCTSTSHCFCNAFTKPKSCRQSRKSCAVINMVRADMRHQYQPPYHSYKHALCNILSMDPSNCSQSINSCLQLCFDLCTACFGVLWRKRENRTCKREGINNGLMQTCSACKVSWSSCFFASNSTSGVFKNTKRPFWHISSCVMTIELL